MTLVVGATGVLGFEVCKRLLAKGVTVRALVRPGSPRESAVADLGAEVVHGDLKDPASLQAACAGMSRVITTANAMTSRRKGDGLKAVDLDGNLALVRAAKAAGVRHFLFTSVSAEANPRSIFIRYKRVVERAVRESGMGWTVFQPAAFMETWFSPVAGWEPDKGTVRIVGPGTAKFNPVSLHDVAEFAALAATRDDMERRVIPVGGPDVVTALEVVRLYEELLDQKLKVKHVPAGVLGIVSTILRPFNPPLSSILAMAAGSARDDVIEMALVLAEIPVELTPLGVFAKRSLNI